MLAMYLEMALVVETPWKEEMRQDESRSGESTLSIARRRIADENEWQFEYST